MASETMGVFHGNGKPATGLLPPPSARLRALGVERDDLDIAIAGLLKAGTYDDLLVARLKKRKLQIKDEIARGMAVRTAPTSNRADYSVELAFLAMLAVIVWCCWPTADDQALLESAALYSVLQNSY
jgi:hypothetical protein